MTTSTLELGAILQVLYANELDHIISHAFKIQNDIPFNDRIGETVVLELRDSDLERGTKFAGGKSYGHVAVTVIQFNMFKIDSPYMVSLPNGKIKWVSLKTLEEGNRANITEIVPKESPVENTSTI